MKDEEDEEEEGNEVAESTTTKKQLLRVALTSGKTQGTVSRLLSQVKHLPWLLIFSETSL